MRKLWIGLGVLVVLFLSLGPTTLFVPAPSAWLPEGAYETVESVLIVSKVQDAGEIQRLRIFADGKQPSLDDIAYALDRNHDFWNFAQWRLIGAAASANRPWQAWIATVEFEYANGYRQYGDLWLAKTRNGWVVTAIPVPFEPAADNAVDSW